MNKKVPERPAVPVRSADRAAAVKPTADANRAAARLQCDSAPLFLVMNASSGNRDAEQTRQTIESVLSRHGRRYEFLEVSDGAQLHSTARRALQLAQAEDGIVVAAGGDGTLNAVSSVVLGTGVVLGILPQGTFNYFGRLYGISQNTEQALDCLLNAVVRPVDVGLINGQLFLVNASLGLYPKLLEDREAFKRRYGRHRLVALWSAIVTLMRAYQTLDLEIDSDGARFRQMRTPTLVVSNNALQLAHVGVHNASESRQHRLVAMISRSRSTLSLYSLLLRGLLSRLGDADAVSSFSFDNMTVRPRRGRTPVKVGIDGEIFFMRAPLRFSVATEKLLLLVPRDNAGRGPS